MLEAKENCAHLEEVDEQTFVRFSQYAYTGDYDAADPIPPPAPDIGNEGHDALDQLNVVEAEPVAIENVTEADYEAGVLAEATLLEPSFELDPRPPSEDVWSSRRHLVRKGKKKKYEYRSMSPEAVPSRSKGSELWQNFNERAEAVSLPEFQPRENREPCEDYTEVFLCHARLYVFADVYDIPPLRNLSLHKLQRTLARFTLYDERVGDIIELLRYAYSNTAERTVSMEKLRSLVTHYAACKVEDLSGNDQFGSLLEEFGDFAKDLVHYMLKRLD